MRTFEIEFDSGGRRFTVRIEAWTREQAVEIFSSEHAPKNYIFISCDEV